MATTVSLNQHLDVWLRDVGHTDLAQLERFRLDEFQYMPVLHILEQCLSPLKIKGLTNNRTSSIKPKFIRLETSVAPPTAHMSFPDRCFSLRISCTSRTIRVFFQST
jgi:hypothetical protein